MLQPVNIQLDFNQLLTIIKQCDIEQKMEIVKKIMPDLKNSDLTLDDIPNAQTKRAIEDARNGKVTKTKNLADLMKKLKS